LIGRRAPSVDALQRIANIEKATRVRIQVLQGDVSSTEDVKRIFGELDREMPALAGVVHSAGVLEDGILTQQSWERYAKVLAPKVAGAWNLHTATEHRDLDFFVLFSSVSALTGSPGQSNYAAANAFMDTLASYRRARGLPAVSIAWGPWADVGMAAGIEADAAKRGWRAEGLGMIQLKSGLNVLGQLMQMPAAQAAVMPFRWPKLFEQFPLMAKQTMFAALAKRFAASKASAVAGAGTADIVRLVNEAPADERLELLAAFVKDQIAKILGFDAERPIDPQKGFFELGGDSLSSVGLRNSLQQALGQPLPTTMIFDYPTIEAITNYLAIDVLKLETASPEPEVEDEAERIRKQLAQEVDQMSDEEAEAELLKELAGLE
jgi:NAD(P)-dependent dehydrogenase (short-subunit alcohol dehydrogenase family)/acyl carrier protein